MKKLVEKAAKLQHQNGVENIQSLKADDVNPRITFHNGIPSESSLMVYDSIQNILAMSTNYGQIKLFGMDGTQALLQSPTASPSKFLQLIENHGILLNINFQNDVELWDIDAKELCYVHKSDAEITSYAVMQQSLYMYIGNFHGDVRVLKLVLEEKKLDNMSYIIPFTESYGHTNEANDSTAVLGIFPQPMAETKRVLLLFEDGHISIWSIQENKTVYSTGGISQISMNHETKKAVAACWACPFGKKLVVGYNNGEVFIWDLPIISNSKNDSMTNQNIPCSKLNLGFKTDKIPVVSLKWNIGDGKASRLYVNGYSDNGSYSCQVIALNENFETRTIKLVLPLTEPCLSMEFITCFSDKTKHKQNSLLLLSKSGQMQVYYDLQIERYLLQLQSKSSPSLPNHFTIKLPYAESSITAAKLYTSCSVESNLMGEEQLVQLKKYSNLFLVDKREKDPTLSNSTKINKLYITGHQDGTLKLWDASCHLLLPVLTIRHHSENGNSSIGVPVTALHFDIISRIVTSGYQNGTVQIIHFKKEQVASENNFSFLQAKRDDMYTIHCVKVKGTVQTIAVNSEPKHLAIGTDKGFVYLFEMEGATMLYQKQFPSQLHTGIISLQFESCNHNGFAKNILFIGIQDSSVLAIEEDTGNELNASAVRTNKPSIALSMQILESNLLFCSENAIRLYSLSHVLQGIKKVNFKKKLSGICCYTSVLYGSSSEVGLVLVFATGKVEIRSLPDLSLLKETSIRGFPNENLRSSTNLSKIICASPEGELVMVNGDQEIIFFSCLFKKDSYRNLEPISQIFKRGVSDPQDGNTTSTNIYKEKKRGIFGMVKDLTGNKQKHNPMQVDSSGVNALEELHSVFSTVNFTLHSESKKEVAKSDEDFELNIDDIEIDDVTKEKGKAMKFAIINKQKLGKKFHAIKGKLMTKTDEKLPSPKDRNDNDTDTGTGSVDQIKKKYGFATNNESNIASIAHNKLSDNVQKLQGINERASDMKDTAQSFSSLANDLLRNLQKDKKNS